MTLNHSHIFSVLLLFSSLYFIVTNGIEEHCDFETVDIQCPDNEIIMITSAQYGRMEEGRCTGENAEDVGCETDVLFMIDRICAGKSTCTYIVGTEGLAKKRPCRKGLSAYLVLDFQCLQVVNSAPASCKANKVHEIQDPMGYISSSFARNNGCTEPQRIKGKPGQRIDITLINFGVYPESRKCKDMGFIYDVGIRKNISICGSAKREEHLYTSNGNVLDISLSFKDSGDFVVKYRVLGCADLLPPDHGWYERSGDKAVLGCQHQDVKWHIQCVQDQWQGVVGNCTQADNFLLIIICCVFGLILIIIVFVLIYISWGKCVKKSPMPQSGQPMVNYNQGTADYMAPGWSASTFNHTQGRANSMYNPAPMAHLLDAPLVEAPPPPQYSQTMSTQYRTGQYQHQHPISNAQQSIYTNLNHNEHNTMEKQRPMEPKYYVLDKDIVDNVHNDLNLMQ